MTSEVMWAFAIGAMAGCTVGVILVALATMAKKED